MSTGDTDSKAPLFVRIVYFELFSLYKEALFGFLQNLIENDEKLDLRKVRAIMPLAGSDELQDIWRLVDGAWPTAGRVWAIWM